MTPIPITNLHHLAIAMLAAAPFAAWIKSLDDGGRYLYANPAAKKLMGSPVEGQTTEQLFGQDTALVQQYEQEAVSRGSSEHIQDVRDQAVIVQRFPLPIAGQTLLCGIAVHKH